MKILQKANQSPKGNWQVLKDMRVASIIVIDLIQIQIIRLR